MSYIVECIMHMPCASQSGFSYYVHVYYLHGISQSPSLWWTMFILLQCTCINCAQLFIIHCLSYTVFIIHCVCVYVCVCLCDTRALCPVVDHSGSRLNHSQGLPTQMEILFRNLSEYSPLAGDGAQPNANTQIQQILKCSMAKKPNSWWHRSPSGKYSITGVVTWLNIYFQKFKRCGWWSFELYLYTTNWK